MFHVNLHGCIITAKQKHLVFILFLELHGIIVNLIMLVFHSKNLSFSKNTHDIKRYYPVLLWHQPITKQKGQLVRSYQTDSIDVWYIYLPLIWFLCWISRYQYTSPIDCHWETFFRMFVWLVVSVGNPWAPADPDIRTQPGKTSTFDCCGLFQYP